MNTKRVEALSDGVFAIAMTLLIIDLQIPKITTGISVDSMLLEHLQKLEPVMLSYFISFIVLAMYWISHHAFFHVITKNVNRVLTLINMLYLSFIAFVPFSAHLLGAYGESRVAVIFYGVNLILISVASVGLFLYALHSHEIDTDHVTPRTIKQAMIRIFLTPVCILIGIGLSFVSLPAALTLYAFPVLFNIFPGGIDFLERHFNLQLD
jgi:uncharacterized membrane protein